MTGDTRRNVPTSTGDARPNVPTSTGDARPNVPTSTGDTRRIVPPSLDTAAGWAWRLLVIAVALGATVFVLVRLWLVTAPVVMAMFIAALLVPPANALRRRGLRPALATSIVFVFAAALLSSLVIAVAPAVADEVSRVDRLVREGGEDVLAWLTTGPIGLTRAQIDDFVGQASSRVRENANEIARGVLEGALTAVELIAAAILALVVAFFFVKDGATIGRAILTVFPEPQREHVREIGSRAWFTLGAYLRGIAVIATVDAVAIAIGLTALRVPLVLPLAMLVFFGAFIPLLGAFAAGTVAALVALVTGGIVKALAVVALIVAVQQVEGHVLTPLVLGRATRLHPVVVLLALTAGAVLGGVVGAFLAVPVAAVGASVLSYVRNGRSAEPGSDTSAAALEGDPPAN